MLRVVLAAAAIVAGAGVVLAQGDPVKARQDLMKQADAELLVLFRMNRGENPFDAARVKTAYEQIEAAAKKFPDAFPAGSQGGSGGNRASPRIWENREDFAAKNAQLVQAIADGKQKATTLDGLKASFGALDRSCNECHRTYRLPRQR